MPSGWQLKNTSSVATMRATFTLSSSTARSAVSRTGTSIPGGQFVWGRAKPL